jgi:hypothetical protein
MRLLIVTAVLAATACGDLEYKMIDAPPPPPDVPADTCTPVTWYADCDSDGVAAMAGETMMSCLMPAASACGGTWITAMPVAGATDCNDANAAIKPGAVEICDTADNNCNGQIDETGLTTFYRDMDNDGHGSLTSSMTTCNAPSGYVTSADDCDDNNGAIHPGAAEVCDGVDNNCASGADEGVMTTYYRDLDNDGHGNAGATMAACSAPSGYVSSSDDCDDNTNLRYPGKAEVCDGVDNNCNVTVDEGVTSTFYRDFDGDGYGTTGDTQQRCAAGGGYIANNTDCNDNSSSIHPNTPEVCFNSVDENCSNTLDDTPECSIDCNWDGARWLSWGYQGGFNNPQAWDIGAWATCKSGKLNSFWYVNNTASPPSTALGQPSSGTSTSYVDCNWGNAFRWASQGWPPPDNTSRGADLKCDGTRVTNINWEGNLLFAPAQIQFPDIVGQLKCNWGTGQTYTPDTIFLTHGLSNQCGFDNGFLVTCVNGHITGIANREPSNCPRSRL